MHWALIVASLFPVIVCLGLLYFLYLTEKERQLERINWQERLYQMARLQKASSVTEEASAKIIETQPPSVTTLGQAPSTEVLALSSEELAERAAYDEAAQIELARREREEFGT